MTKKQLHATRERPPRQKKESVVVPKRYAGQWIAWDRRRFTIVGHGASLLEARSAAEAAGETDPGYEWVPPANLRIVGFHL